MADIKRTVSEEVGMTDCSKYSLSRANCVPIYEDLKYILNQSRDVNVGADNRNRYARISIVFMAFYLEVLANSIFDKDRNDKEIYAELEKTDRRNDLSKPVRKYRAEYFKAYGNELPINVNGVQDIFIIRNKIMAHPKERTTVSSNDPAMIDIIGYLKFKDFPIFYPMFVTEHSEILFVEMKDFLNDYLVAMKDNIPEWLHVQLRIS